MQDVQTLSRRLLPPGRFTTCTVWTLGSHRRLVRRWECDTDLPKPGPFPPISHTAAIVQTPRIFSGSGTWPGHPRETRAKPGYRLWWATTKTIDSRAMACDRRCRPRWLGSVGLRWRAPGGRAEEGGSHWACRIVCWTRRPWGPGGTPRSAT